MLTSLLERVDTRPVTDFTFQQTALPAAAVAIYFIVWLLLPMYMAPRKPMSVDLPYKIWNFALGVFAIIGASYSVPAAWNSVATHGFVGMLCQDPQTLYYDSMTRLWVDLFGLSKFVDLGDLFFLVLQKKPLPTSHWVHHSGVLLFCWHAHQARGGYDVMFVAINFVTQILWHIYLFLQPKRPPLGFIFVLALMLFSFVELALGTAASVLTLVHYSADAIACPAIPSHTLCGFVLCVVLLFFFFQSAPKKLAAVRIQATPQETQAPQTGKKEA